MNLGLFAPAFLAGLGLLTLPWLIHQIRRPEREPLRFSSLLFIPRIEKQVIERRRLQHLLLMLLRMAALAALTVAFTRPYWRVPAGSPTTSGPGLHVVALDVSYGMGRARAFDEARRKALEVVDRLRPEDRVGVVTFGLSPRVRAPLRTADDPEAGGRDRARTALRAAALSEEGTDYLAALQLAQDLLFTADESTPETAEALWLHLVTDFQAQGLAAASSSGWKLSPRIVLEPIPVDTTQGVNLSVTDLSARPVGNEELRVQARIRNWSENQDQRAQARLILAEASVATKSIDIAARNSTLVSFQLPLSQIGEVEGRVEIEPDALETDNRRYFLARPLRRKRLILLADDAPEERWPASWFLAHGLGSADSTPWDVIRSTPEELGTHLRESGTLPEVVILGGLKLLEPTTVDQLLGYVAEGGALLAPLSGGWDDATLNQRLLPALGLRATGRRFPVTRQSRFDMLAWIDFEHPVFAPLRGARFNDFSQVRFYNYHMIQAEDGDGPAGAAKILARLEGEGADEPPPAMLEIRRGQGRLIVWAFGPELEWTNLPKNIKFIPVFHETLLYLSGAEAEGRSWTVGEVYDRLPLPSGALGTWIVEAPSDGPLRLRAADLARCRSVALRGAGFLRWRSTDQATWEQIEPINVDPREADPQRVGLEEFRLRLTAAPALEARSDGGAEAEDERPPEGFAVRARFGPYLLAALLGLLIVESWYAPRLLR